MHQKAINKEVNKAVIKDMKSKRKFCRQLFSKYLETFWWFSNFFFHHKWNEAWLLVVSWYIPVALGVAERLDI